MPTEPVPASPVSVTLASPVTDSLPTAPVPATFVIDTSTPVVPHVPDPQVSRPQPVAMTQLRYSNNSVTCVCGWKGNSKATCCTGLITAKIKDRNRRIACSRVIENHTASGSYRTSTKG